MHERLSNWEVRHNGKQTFSLAFESTVDMLGHKKLLKVKKGLGYQTVAMRSRNTSDTRSKATKKSMDTSPKVSKFDVSPKTIVLNTVETSKR